MGCRNDGRSRKGIFIQNAATAMDISYPNGRYQYANCCYQVSVKARQRYTKPIAAWPAGFWRSIWTVLKNKASLRNCQHSFEQSIYKTTRYMLNRTYTTIKWRDKSQQLSDAIIFDNVHFERSVTGKNGALVVLFLDKCGNSCYLKMQVAENIKQDSIEKSAQPASAENCVIRSVAIAAVSRCWRAIFASQSPSILNLACFIGYTS